MKAAAYTPADLPSPLGQRLAELLRHTWFRGMTRHSPTVTRKHRSTNTEVDGVFRAPSISRIGQLSVFTTDIGWSRAWYEDAVGLRHSRTMELEPHPLKPGRQIRCCYLSAQYHDECLVLIEEYDSTGKIIVPSGMSFLHFALELEGGSQGDETKFTTQGFDFNEVRVRDKGAAPVINGEAGRNVPCCLYDPDWNYVEFCDVMDVESNDRERCDDTEGRQPQSLDFRRAYARPGSRSPRAAIEARADAAAE